MTKADKLKIYQENKLEMEKAMRRLGLVIGGVFAIDVGGDTVEGPDIVRLEAIVPNDRQVEIPRLKLLCVDFLGILRLTLLNPERSARPNIKITYDQLDRAGFDVKITDPTNIMQKE